VLAIKCEPAGFRGINGAVPARTRVPSIYSTTRRFPLDRCARRDLQDAGNPAQSKSLEPPMNTQDNASADTSGQNTSVVARRIEDSERLMTLPRHFGHRLLTFESEVYNFMRRFAADYRGGFWEFYELSNGGFYMAPEGRSFRFSVETNGYDGLMFADAAGITVCLFAYSHLSFRDGRDNLYAKHFHWLREFAIDHSESRDIFAAID
jgi:hypothetical protein